MFYCEDCRSSHGWPGLRIASIGRCEMCEKPGVECYDVPSKFLPLPEKADPEEPIPE